MTMEPRLNYTTLAPRHFQAMLGLSAAVHESSIGRTLVDLVLLRVSQLNGCSYCVDLHYRDLVQRGEAPRKINAVAGWRESPFFEPRERAALAWAEIVSAIPVRDPDDAAFAAVKQHFSDSEIVELTFTIGTITVWNMLNVSARMPVSS